MVNRSRIKWKNAAPDPSRNAIKLPVDAKPGFNTKLKSTSPLRENDELYRTIKTTQSRENSKLTSNGKINTRGRKRPITLACTDELAALKPEIDDAT